MINDIYIYDNDNWKNIAENISISINFFFFFFVFLVSMELKSIDSNFSFFFLNKFRMFQSVKCTMEDNRL